MNLDIVGILELNFEVIKEYQNLIFETNNLFLVHPEFLHFTANNFLYEYHFLSFSHQFEVICIFFEIPSVILIYLIEIKLHSQILREFIEIPLISRLCA